MVAVVNTSKYPVFSFNHRLLVGNPYLIIILKQSFRLQENGKLKELDEQIGIRMQDIVKDNPRWDSVRYPSDLIPYKPKLEVILNGIAQSEEPKKQWICGIDLKQPKNKHFITSLLPVEGFLKNIERFKDKSDFLSWSKQILVTGNRYWQRDGNRWKLREIEATNSVELSHEYAYGGHFLLKPTNSLTQDADSILELSYPLNPSGRGWLPSKTDINKLEKEKQKELEKQLVSLDTIAAPQLFAVDSSTLNVSDNLDSPYQTVPVAGFGSYVNFWQMRTQYLSGDLDWSEESTDGGYPADFDMRHWQQAPADQWVDFKLKGNEILTLTGFFPEGKQSYVLPRTRSWIVIRQPNELAMNLDMNIDTLVIDTQKRTLEIVWRRIVLLTHVAPDAVIECNNFIAYDDNK